MTLGFVEGAEAGGSRAILHNLRRGLIPWTQWDNVADSIAKWIAQEQTAFCRAAVGGSAISDQTVADFRAVGLGNFGRLLDDAAVSEIVDYLKRQPGYAGHHVSSSDRRQYGFDDLSKRERYCAYDPVTILKAPHLAALANLRDVLDLVERALGCVPTLYSVSAWWSFPFAGPPWPPYSQHFHRDDDDFRFFTFFAYLTDVTVPEDGASQLLPTSHTIVGLESLIAEASGAGRLDPAIQDPMATFAIKYPKPIDAVERTFGPRILSTLGEKGTCFITDTRALHRGLKPTTKPRLIFWARYGLGPNSNSSDTDMPAGRVHYRTLGSRIDDSPRSRYINRLLVDF